MKEKVLVVDKELFDFIKSIKSLNIDQKKDTLTYIMNLKKSIK